MAEMFSNASSYEKFMGRWSARLAPLFVEFARVRDGDRVLDVGCGTGSLVQAVANLTRRSGIVGIDPTPGFIAYSRQRFADPRITFDQGSAFELPYPESSFDQSLSMKMSRYEILNDELVGLHKRQAMVLGAPALAGAVLAYVSASPSSLGASLFATVVTFVLGLLLFHPLLKAVFRPYKQWTERSAHIAAEISRLRQKVSLIFEKYQEREKGEHFKKAYDLAGRSLHELEEALSVGMYREKREIFVTAFIQQGIAVRVTASIGSPYRCAPADSPGDWKKHIDRLTCDEIRQYHNHPAHNGTTRPSSQDFRTTQTLRSLLGSHGTKLRSLIICWNSICEWKIFEYDESGKYWLCSEFDAAV